MINERNERSKRETDGERDETERECKRDKETEKVWKRKDTEIKENERERHKQKRMKGKDKNKREWKRKTHKREWREKDKNKRKWKRKGQKQKRMKEKDTQQETGREQKEIQSVGHIIKHSTTQDHILNKGFIGVLDISWSTPMILVVVWAFLCTANLKQHSLQPDWLHPRALGIADVGSKTVLEYWPKTEDVGRTSHSAPHLMINVLQCGEAGEVYVLPDVRTQPLLDLVRRQLPLLPPHLLHLRMVHVHTREVLGGLGKWGRGGRKRKVSWFCLPFYLWCLERMWTFAILFLFYFIILSFCRGIYLFSFFPTLYFVICRSVLTFLNNLFLNFFLFPFPFIEFFGH